MRFDPTAPGRSTPVTWYFCPPGAQIFPAAHSFGSFNWYKGSGVPDAPVGELQAVPRPWSNGKAPAEATGQTVCAPLSAFLSGLSYLVTPRPQYPDGYPTCCNQPAGGLFLEGGGIVSRQCSLAPVATQVVFHPTAPLNPLQPWTVGEVVQCDLIGGPTPILLNRTAGGGQGFFFEPFCDPFYPGGWSYAAGRLDTYPFAPIYFAYGVNPLVAGSGWVGDFYGPSNASIDSVT